MYSGFLRTGARYLFVERSNLSFDRTSCKHHCAPHATGHRTQPWGLNKMDTDKAFTIARSAMATPLPEKAAPDASPSIFPKTVEQDDEEPREPVLAISEALRIVREVADGHFAPQAESTSKEVVSALCVVVAHLAAQPETENELAAVPEVSSARGTMSLDDYLREVERREVILALEASRGNATKAATLLGISYRSLRYRLENLGFE